MRDVEVVQAASHDDYIPLVTSVPSPCNAAAAEAFIRRQWERLPSGAGYSFALAESATDRAVGQLGVWLDDYARHQRVTMGYWVAPAERGRGAATKALLVATAWAFRELRAVRCQLHVEPWNIQSWRAAERAGYAREGLLRSWQEVGGTWRDMYCYATVRQHAYP